MSQPTQRQYRYRLPRPVRPAGWPAARNSGSSRLVNAIAVAVLAATIGVAYALKWSRAPQAALAASNAAPAVSAQPRLVERATKLGPVLPALPGSPTADQFAMPQLRDEASGLALVIPADRIPAQSRAVLLQRGSGSVPQLGERVTVHYDMFSWSTGALIDQVPAPITLWTGTAHPQVPDYLEQAIDHQPYGSQLLVVLGRGAADLQERLNSNDAYVLVVEVTAPQEQPALLATHHGH